MPKTNTTRKTPEPDADASAGASITQLLAGIVLLLVAIASSAALVLASLNALALPGCGEGSGCAAAANSVWGKLPVLNWPLSWVGAAWFGGLLVAFIMERGRLPGILRQLVRVSTVGSVVLVVAMIANGYVCNYCLVVHGANLGFWLLLEFAAPRRGHALRAGGALAGVFALTIAVLFVIDARTRADVIAEAETQRQQSVQDILEAPAADRLAFTGRYHYGPENAPMHIVMFTDYQCPDCYKIEQQVERLFNERTDISLSTKHFPFCVDCNHKVTNNLHPNACWAARAVETAGKLGGPDAFWATHFWLFSIKGTFNDAQLQAHVRSLGLNYASFLATMQSPEIDALIKADIEEAVSLGLYFTPMIFINGRELRGTATPDILYRTIQDLATRRPEPTPAVLPPPAREKYIEDWRLERVRAFRADFVPRVRGSASPTLDIVVWGDYLAEQMQNLDREITRIMRGRDDVRYTYRHFPVNPNCNPRVSLTFHELSCDAARAVEAAGQIGGDDAYWSMHQWVLDHHAEFTANSARDGAAAIGLDPDALVAQMQHQDVTLAIQEDIEAGNANRFRGIPACFVNGKFVPRLFLDGDCILDDIASEVLGEDVTN